VRPGKACAGVIIPGVFRPNMPKSYRLGIFEFFADDPIFGHELGIKGLA